MNQINWAWWTGLPTDPLSHAGLSVAAVFAGHYLFRQIFGSFGSRRDRSTGPANWSRVSGWNIDYRLVIIGSLLPDLIDKSLQLWFFPEALNLPGRSIAHTLVFNSILVVLSLVMMPINRSLGPLLFALASAGHLLFDRMWESPATLFWPQFGLSFGHAEFKLSPSWLDWTQNGIGPALLDWIGALVLLMFVFVLYRRRTLLRWIRMGIA